MHFQFKLVIQHDLPAGVFLKAMRVRDVMMAIGNYGIRSTRLLLFIYGYAWLVAVNSRLYIAVFEDA
jgi:hypothetical protein